MCFSVPLGQMTAATRRQRILEMCTAGMGGTGLVLASLLLLLGSVTVYSYEDLRGFPCRNETTYSAVPPERAQWLGSVQLTLECDKGYDLPLNAPPNSTLTCYPNGSTWLPDYLPDCNAKIIAESATMTLIGNLSKARCDSLGKLTVSRTTLAFGSSLQVVVSRKCKLSPLGSCIVQNGFKLCEDNQKDLTPHLSLRVNFAIGKSTAWSTYQTITAKLGLSILRDLEASAPSSHVNVHNTPVCALPGTLGVLRAGVEVVCRGCSLGHYLDVEKKTCLPCPPGYYGDMVHATICKLCPGLHSYYGTPEWKTIITPVPNRASAISNCPILYKHQNGTLEVRVPSRVQTQLTRVETGKDEDPDELNDGEEPFLGSKLTVAAFALAALCVA